MNGWDSYRFILALDRAGTLRGAAKILGIDHSTVSRKLAWLNHKKNHAVFERVPGGYQITEAGQPLLAAAVEIERVVLSADRKQRAYDDAAVSGSVTLSVSQPIAEYLLSDQLPRFAALFPNIELCIDATEHTVDLDKSEADLVIRSADNPPEHLVGKRLFPYAVCFYGHRDYLAETAVEDYQWIGAQHDSLFPDWVKSSPYPHAPVHVRTTGYHMRYLALTSKMGISRAACFMADTHPDLVRLADAEPFTTLDFWVLTHPDLRHSPRIRAVMDFLVSALTDKKDLIQGQHPQPR